jgi:hypothetical protein
MREVEKTRVGRGADESSYAFACAMLLETERITRGGAHEENCCGYGSKADQGFPNEASPRALSFDVIA